MQDAADVRIHAPNVTDLAINGARPARPRPLPPRVRILQSTRQAMDELLASGAFSDWRGGQRVREFERVFADLHGEGYHSVAVNSGTSALHLACAALGLGPGDEVVIPCAAYVSAASAVVQVGATPVICDVDPVTLTMDLEAAARCITPRTKALLPVHFWGCPSDMNDLMALAERNGLHVIEDCGQSHGARIGDRVVGSFGTVACYSFAPRKHISTGQGGACVTRDEGLARSVADLANKGKGLGWLDYQTLGFSYVMADFEALLGINGVAILEEEIASRRAAAWIYADELASTGLRLWGDPPWGTHVYFKVPVAVPVEYRSQLDWLIRAVHAENVSCRPTHPPLSSIGWLAEYAAQQGRPFRREHQPNAYEALPLIFEVESGPGLTEDDVRVSARVVRKVFEALL